MLKCLTLQIPLAQIQSNFSEIILTQGNDQFSIGDIVETCKSLGRTPEVDMDEDHKLLNLNFFTEELEQVWQRIQALMLNDEPMGQWLRAHAIVACEGDNGWDDYLLLMHPDPAEKIDTLS